MITALHRNRDDVIGQYEGLISADAVEKQKAEGNLFAGLEDVLKLYEKALWGCMSMHNNEVSFPGIEFPALEPEEINRFLLATIPYETDRVTRVIFDSAALRTGVFISGLINASYERGNRIFRLNTACLIKADYLGHLARGRKGRHLKIEIQGNAGYKSGSYAKGAIISVSGNAGDWFGEHATHCKISIGGDAEWYCCTHARNSTITIYGSAGHMSGFGAKQCVFKSPNIKSLEEIVKNVGKGNKLYLMHPNGKEELVWK